MKFYQPSKEQAPYGLRAVTMVAKAAEGGIAQSHKAMLAADQHLIWQTAIDLDRLEPITPEELAQHFSDPHLARQLVQSMVLMSLANGPTSQEQEKLIKAFATALKVEEPAVDTIQHLVNHNMAMFYIDIYRYSNANDYIKAQYRTQGGIWGVAKALLGVIGLVEDKELAGRFHALKDLPDNTLGSHFYHYYVNRGFAFPGEKGGSPLGFVWHDFGHILGGYDITPQDEILVSAFQAGYRRTENAFYTLLFGFLIHSTGINVAPIPMPKLIGRIGQGDLAEQMIKALKRGVEMKTDLGADWNFWPYLPMPLEEVRKKLGVSAAE
ncbi:MAG: hypothetical protein J7647_06115 [Cyanobacteria bacterium SBLK]|nr:hypothetical protein [Cyanobacteria bacterium SBLK]